MKDFRKLTVWLKAHELTLAAYKATRVFPKDELYGMTSQIRRCAASVPANLAEGCGRGTDADFARFVRIACGSANELEYHFLLARDLELLDKTVHRALNAGVVEVKRMLTALEKTLRSP
jgi:four helix bundle protein